MPTIPDTHNVSTWQEPVRTKQNKAKRRARARVFAVPVGNNIIRFRQGGEAALTILWTLLLRLP